MIMSNNSTQRTKLIVNVLVIALALVSFSQRGKVVKESSPFERILVDLIAPIQQSVTETSDFVSSAVDHYLLNIKASKENIELKKEVASLKEKILYLSELDKENQRLKGLLNQKISSNYSKVLAQVVSWDSNHGYRVIRINRGASSGLQLQSVVVTSEGVVGYVYRLTDNFADVLTIMDSNNRVDGLIQRTRSHGIVEGYSDTRTIMKYISRTEKVVLGDVVLTSGLGNIYPKGLVIGQVARIEKESFGITQAIELNTAVNFRKLEEVVVLVRKGQAKISREWKALDEQKERN